VLPLDDVVLLDKAKPVSPDGKVKADPATVEARHDAQVKAAIASGPVSLIVLGGAHDLSSAVRRVASDKVEYLRVTTGRFKAIAK
jgi:saccharopine dehydrogenase-like NADP-dependent oxidoreductase